MSDEFTQACTGTDLDRLREHSLLLQYSEPSATGIYSMEHKKRFIRGDSNEAV